MHNDQKTTAAKIMIGEDDGLIANHISSIVTKNGYEVTGIAGSSDEAFADIARFHPQLILMDISIRGAMDGVDTAVNLRETSDVPQSI